MKYLKYFESYTEIGTVATFAAKHITRGLKGDYGSGFILQRKNEKGKWLGNIDCKDGTEVTGEIISIPNDTDVLKVYKIKLTDGSFVTISLDLFNKV